MSICEHVSVHEKACLSVKEEDRAVIETPASSACEKVMSSDPEMESAKAPVALGFCRWALPSPTV